MRWRGAGRARENRHSRSAGIRQSTRNASVRDVQRLARARSVETNCPGTAGIKSGKAVISAQATRERAATRDGGRVPSSSPNPKCGDPPGFAHVCPFSKPSAHSRGGVSATRPQAEGSGTPAALTRDASAKGHVEAISSWRPAGDVGRGARDARGGWYLGAGRGGSRGARGGWAAAPKRRERGRTCHPSPLPLIVVAPASLQTPWRRLHGSRRAWKPSSTGSLRPRCDGRSVRRSSASCPPSPGRSAPSCSWRAKRSHPRPGARLVLAGFNARRLGRLLRRADGVEVCGYVAHASGTEAGAVLWDVLRVP